MKENEIHMHEIKVSRYKMNRFRWVWGGDGDGKLERPIMNYVEICGRPRTNITIYMYTYMGYRITFISLSLSLSIHICIYMYRDVQVPNKGVNN